MDLFAGVGNNAISFALQPHPEDPARRRWDRVVAVERDPATLACAQHNAALHGLGPGSVVWVLGDSFEFLERAVAAAGGTGARPAAAAANGRGRRGEEKGPSPSSSASSSSTSRKGGRRRPAHETASEDSDSGSGSGSDDDDSDDESDDVDGDGNGNDDDDDDGSEGEDIALDPAATVLFASPPWGGPGYSTDAVFDLDTMEPYGLARLHGAYRAMDHALYLPRTSDLRQIARLAPPGRGGEGARGPGNGSENPGGGSKGRRKIEVVQYCVEGASKALVAYIPAAESAGGNSDGVRGGDEEGSMDVD